MSSVIIRPPTGGVRIPVRELVRYRELIYFLLWRDVKVRYKQSAFGAVWAILQPLSLMLLFAIFFGRLAGLPSEGIPYPVFAYSALLPWTLFSQSLTAASTSLVQSSSVVSKVYFPRLVIPLAASASHLVDFAVALTLLLPLMLWYGIPLSPTVLLAIPFAILAFVVAVSVGTGLSAVNVRYRDVQYTLPLLVQVWLFASPVIYPASLVPDEWRWFYNLNPMVAVIEGFRWSLVGAGSGPDLDTLTSLGTTAVIAVLALSYFQRMERTFADIV